MSQHAGTSGQRDDLSRDHAVAYSSWLHAKTTENEARKIRLTAPLTGGQDAFDFALRRPARPSIVVVDDDPNVAITLSEILQRRGYGVVWFTEPIAALAFIGTYEPDLLLADVTMPFVDGLELMMHVQRMYPACPILLLTALGDDPQSAQCVLASGCNVALEVKPLLTRRLFRRVARLISARSARPSNHSANLGAVTNGFRDADSA